MPSESSSSEGDEDLSKFASVAVTSDEIERGAEAVRHKRVSKQLCPQSGIFHYAVPLLTSQDILSLHTIRGERLMELVSQQRGNIVRDMMRANMTAMMVHAWMRRNCVLQEH